MTNCRKAAANDTCIAARFTNSYSKGVMHIAKLQLTNQNFSKDRNPWIYIDIVASNTGV